MEVCGVGRWMNGDVEWSGQRGTDWWGDGGQEWNGIGGGIESQSRDRMEEWKDDERRNGEVKGR